MKIEWDPEAIIAFEDSMDLIAEVSLNNSELVTDRILTAIEELLRFPERHPPDRFKVDNKGDFRAFEVDGYRVSYLIRGASICHN